MDMTTLLTTIIIIEKKEDASQILYFPFCDLIFSEFGWTTGGLGSTGTDIPQTKRHPSTT